MTVEAEKWVPSFTTVNGSHLKTKRTKSLSLLAPQESPSLLHGQKPDFDANAHFTQFFFRFREVVQISSVIIFT